MTSATSSRSSTAWVWLLVIGVAALLRTLNIWESFWIDEAMSAAVIEEPWDILVTRVGFSDVHPPGYYLFLKSWSALFGTSDVALRALSWLASMGATVWVTAWALRRYGSLIAVFAGLALATSTFHVHYAVEARSYALFGFLTLAFMLSLEGWIGRGHRRTLRLAVLFEVLAIYLHYYGFITAIVANLYVMLRGRHLPEPRAWWRSQAWAVVGLSPWFGVLWVQLLHLPPSMTGHLSDTLPLTRIIAAMGPSPSSGPLWLGVVSGALLFGLAGLGARHVRLDHKVASPRALMLPELVALLSLGVIGPLLVPTVLPLSETLLDLYLMELPKAYGLIALSGGVIALCAWFSPRHGGLSSLSPVIWFIVLGPLLIVMIHQIKPILFLRNMMLFLPFIVLAAAAGLSRTPRLAQLCMIGLWVGLAPLSLAQGPETFMPRQDFKGVAQSLVEDEVDELWVLPSWDAMGVERYADSAFRVQGVSSAQAIGQRTSEVWILLSRPERFSVSEADVIEALSPRFAPAHVRQFSGHRGKMRLIQMRR